MKLEDIFGSRLKMVATVGRPEHLCAVVDRIALEDLDACAKAFAKTRPVPLIIAADELRRALDAFPLEFSEILATRRVIAGDDLFASLQVPREDLRRACEAQARSHLLHLREAYIEAAGNRKAIGRLVSSSVQPFRSLLANIARLDGTSVEALEARFDPAARDFPSALAAAERLVEHVDRWARG